MSVRHRSRLFRRPVRSPLKYLDNEHTFVAGMAKREGPGPFAAAPIVQGRWDGTGVADAVRFSRGGQITGNFYATYDSGQGSFVVWLTPEWDGDDGLEHRILGVLSAQAFLIKNTSNELVLRMTAVDEHAIDISAWTAGTTYQVTARWDAVNSIDGSNYMAISIDDVHAFGQTNSWSPETPFSTLQIGQNVGRAFDGIIEGFHVYRRPLYDGEFGVDANGVDEIAAIVAAGVGADPTLITGSWDCVFAMPTDSAVGALVTGAGEAWSHPHSSNVPHQFFMADGYHGGNHNAVEYNATTTDVNCGSAAVLDNIPAADFTWDCWVKLESRGEAEAGRLFSKSGNFTCICNSDTRITLFLGHAGTTAAASLPIDYDGKWHHIMAVWDQGTLTFEHFFLDGRDLIASVVVGVGAYNGDAANDLHIGNEAFTVRTIDGAMAWFRFSDNKREVADFIAPRLFPAADGNTIEAWSFDDGTGANIVAQVASPGNDGTLANGVWITPWAEEGTPLSVQGIEFDGAATSVRIPDAVALQDLADDAFTAGAWVRADGWGEGDNGFIFGKGWGGGAGWTLGIQAGGGLIGGVRAATTGALSRSGTDDFDGTDGKLHYVTMQYDDAGDRKVYLWVDGIPVASYLQQTAAVGAIVSDVGDDLYAGNRTDGARTWDGLLGGWSRISNISRYVNGEAFLPPAPTNAPALPDVNTVWQTDYSDGAGGTLTDDSATGSDGVITIGAGRWWNTRDANLNDSGEMPFGAGGYMFGTDAANEGIEQTWAGLTPGENYVVRAVVFPTADGNFYAQIAIRDETNGANIVLFDGPRYVGAHTGANNSATLINAGARWPQSLVGATVYNITDGSLGDITAISGDGTIITAALAGGTDDDWDTGDVHRIVWAVATDPINDGYWRHPWIETFTFELPTMARNGVGADCVSISARILNVNNDGTLVCAQLELLELLSDNPSQETGVLVPPYILDGWTNNGLDAGDTVQDVATLHSGVASVEWNPGAVLGEGQYVTLATAIGTFLAFGGWTYGDGSDGFRLGPVDVARALLQYSTTVYQLLTPITAVWSETVGVYRALHAAPRFQIEADAIGGDGFSDDLYLYALDPVTLTITPANEPNSAESGGIRVDGYDALTQPVLNRLKARSGHIIWRGRPRHSPANLIAFREDAGGAYILDIRGVAMHVLLLGTVANTPQIQFQDGGGIHFANWAAAGAWAADDELFWEVYWRGHFMQLAIAGIPVATINQPVDFAALLTALNWGMTTTGDTQGDLVIKEP